jgi:hypothetical protein
MSQVAWLVLSMMAAFAPCAAAQGPALGANNAVPNASGFLQDYSRVKPVPEVEPVLASWAQDFKARLNAVQGR